MDYSQATAALGTKNILARPEWRMKGMFIWKNENDKISFKGEDGSINIDWKGSAEDTKAKDWDIIGQNMVG